MNRFKMFLIVVAFNAILVANVLASAQGGG